MVAVGRGYIDDPRWAWHAGDELGVVAPFAAPTHTARNPNWIKNKRKLINCPRLNVRLIRAMGPLAHAKDSAPPIGFVSLFIVFQRIIQERPRSNMRWWRC